MQVNFFIIYIAFFISFLNSSRTFSQAAFPVLPYSELESTNIILPFIKYYGNDSTLLVYGSNHTNDWENPQINDIINRVQNFNPDVLMYEGDGISTEINLKQTVETYFESGLVKYLADSLQIESINIEPPSREKYNHLLKKYSTGEIMLATLGLQITMMQYNNQDFNQYFPIMITALVDEGLPLDSNQLTREHFNSIYKKYFKEDFSYLQFDSRNFQSKYNHTLFNKINQEANEYRDQHILKILEEQIKKDKKVFLQIGGWHAIVCEPAFRYITSE